MLGKRYRLITSLIAACVLVSCGSLSNSVRVSVVFDHVDGLKSGHVVQFKGMEIGKVKAVRQTAEGATVRLQIAADEASQVQRNAAAIIVDGEPQQVRIYNPGTRGDPITEGDTLYGLNSSLELLAWQAGSSVGAMTHALQEATDTVEDYFESEEWERAKGEMQMQLDLLAKESSETLERMGKDYAALLNELEAQSEVAMDEARKLYAALSKELEAQLREFREKGRHDLADALQRLLDALKSAMEEQEYRTI